MANENMFAPEAGILNQSRVESEPGGGMQAGCMNRG
jgi:hypothetical protein